jgi:acetolactate synthase-1/2/3 large subunit
MKLSDYVFQRIAAQGVKHVFMFPGGGAMHLVDSLGRCKDLQFVCNLHEQACAIAAEAYAKVTNNLGVALVTTGPGGTNAITGCVAAWLDSTPCVFISGQVKRADLKGSLGVRQMGVQEVDIVSLVKDVTKYAITVMDPNDIQYHMDKALFLAKSNRQGPVWIDIPLDVQATEINIEECRKFDAHEFHVSENQENITQLASSCIDLINGSERPVILAGNGIRLAKAENDFLAAVDMLQIPVLTTWLGIDLIHDAHKLFVGRPGSIAPRGANFALQNADLLLSIGARLDMAMIGYAYQNLARGAKKIIVDIDSSEIRKISTHIDVPIVSDARVFIQELLKQKDRVKENKRGDWSRRCCEWKKKYPVVTQEHYKQKEFISTFAFSEMLSEELAETDIVAPGSSGNGVEIFLLVYKTKPGQRVFHARGLGSMGFGLPASIGACLGSGGKRTICVDGDGGFQLNIQELETVKRLQLPIKFFVINNKGYGSIRAMQKNFFGLLTGSDATSGLTLPDLISVASAYGLMALRISDPKDLRKQIANVLQLPGPVVCDVVVTPDEFRAPRLSSKQRADGTMVSSPLEDLWPFLDRDEFKANMLIEPLEQ